MLYRTIMISLKNQYNVCMCLVYITVKCIYCYVPYRLFRTLEKQKKIQKL